MFLSMCVECGPDCSHMSAACYRNTTKRTIILTDFFQIRFGNFIFHIRFGNILDSNSDSDFTKLIWAHSICPPPKLGFCFFGTSDIGLFKFWKDNFFWPPRYELQLFWADLGCMGQIKLNGNLGPEGPNFIQISGTPSVGAFGIISQV